MKSFTAVFTTATLVTVSACDDPFVNDELGKREDVQAEHSTESGFDHGKTLAKLEKIVIPYTPSEALPLIDVIALLQQMSVELDTVEADPVKKGIHFDVWDSRMQKGGTRHGNDLQPYSSISIPIDDKRWMSEVTIVKESIKLGDLIKELAMRANLDVYLTSQGIALVPEGADPNPTAREDVEIWQALRKSP